MKSHLNHTDILISGAGPSGLVGALLLARLGIRSIVIERKAKTDEHPKAHELNARSVEILREIGISEADLNLEASPLEDGSRILFCRTMKEEFGRIDLLEDPGRRAKYEEHLQQALPYFNLSQSEFEKILVHRAVASEWVDLRFGHTWDALVSNTTDRTVSRIVDGTTGDTYEVESSYLLGCDGAGSPIRKALGIDLDGPAELSSFVNAFFKYNLREHVAAPAKLYWIAHPEYAGSFIAHHIEKRWVYVVPFYRKWESLASFTPEFFKERIQGALGVELPDLEIESISPWRMTAQVVRKYAEGRVYLLGDAAHRFPPTGGLGMNTGIADAHNIAWKIASVLKGKADSTLLESYEMERRPVAVKNCAESRENSENIMEVFSLLGLDLDGMEKLAQAKYRLRFLPVKLRDALTSVPKWIADRKLRRVFTDVRLRAKVDATVSRQIGHFDRLGLDIGYTYEAGAIIDDGSSVDIADDEVSDYIPSTRPGARLPHCWVDTTEGRKSVHDFLVYDRFILFTHVSGISAEPVSSEIPLHCVDTSSWSAVPEGWPNAMLVRPDGHIAWRGDAWDPRFIEQLTHRK